MEHKKITVVDEQDNFIGYMSYDEAIEKKMIRRASVVFLQDENGNHLIAKRSKFISKPLLLGHASAGHVDEGETYKEAAVRELEEELGLKNVLLTEVASSVRHDSFFDTIYKGFITTNTTITIDPHEVDSTKWMTTEEVDMLVSKTPELCNPHFVSIWKKMRDRLIE